MMMMMMMMMIIIIMMLIIIIQITHSHVSRLHIFQCEISLNLVYNNDDDDNNDDNNVLIHSIKILIHNKCYNELNMTCKIHTLSNGNRTEWSPIRSVIIRVITKSDDRAAGVGFVYHEYDYRPNWTTWSPTAN